MFNWFFNIFKVAKKQPNVSEQDKATYQERVNSKLQQILGDNTDYIAGIPFNDVVYTIFNSIYNKTNKKGLRNSYKTALAAAEGDATDITAALDLDYILIAAYLQSATGKANVLSKTDGKVDKEAIKEVLSSEIADDIIGTSSKNLGLNNLLKTQQGEAKVDPTIPDSDTELQDEEGNKQTATERASAPKEQQPEYELTKDEEKQDIKKVLSRVRNSKEISSDTKNALIAWLTSTGASLERAPKFGNDFDDKAAHDRMPKEVAAYVGILEDKDEQGDFLNKAINTTKVSVPAISSEKISLEELSEIVDVTEKTNLLFRNIASGKENLFVSAGELLSHYNNVEAMLKSIAKKVADKSLDEEEGVRLSQAIKKETRYSQLKQFVDRIDNVKGLKDVIEKSDATSGTPEYNDYEERRKEYYGTLNNVFNENISVDKEQTEQVDTPTTGKLDAAGDAVNEAKKLYADLTAQLRSVKDKDSVEYQDLVAKVNTAHNKYAQQLRAYNTIANKLNRENIPTQTEESEPKDVSFAKYLKAASKSVSGRTKYLKKLLIANKASATSHALTDSLNKINETRQKALKELSVAKGLTADEKTLFKKYIATAAYGATNRVTQEAIGNTVGGGSRINTERLNEQFADTLMNSVTWDKANALVFLKEKDVATDTTYEEAVEAYKNLFDDSVTALTDEQKKQVLGGSVKTASDELYNIYVNPEEATVPNNYISQERIQDFLNILARNALNMQDAQDRRSLRKEYKDSYGTALDTVPVDLDTIKQDLNNGALERVIAPKESEIGESVLEDLDTAREQLQQKEQRKGKTLFNKAKTEWILQDVDNNLKDLEKKLQDKDLPEEQKQELQKEYDELESKRNKLSGEDLKKHVNELQALDSDIEYLRKKINTLFDKSSTVDIKSAAEVWADKHAIDPEVLKNYDYSYQDGKLVPVVEHLGYWFPIYKDYNGAPQLDDTSLEDPVIIRKEDKDTYKTVVNGETYIRDSETGFYYKADKETNSIENAVPHQDLPKEKPETKHEVNKGKTEEVDQEQQDGKSFREKEENPFWPKNLAPTLNEPLPIKTRVEDSDSEEGTKEEKIDGTEEDIVKPTQDEENETASAGFYFGIQKTAAFFKFAESDDNYTENNDLANSKEQKAIETGDMEGGFQYTPTEQSKAEDVEDNTEFSMEKLGKVLKQIKTKSPEKWQEVLDLVKQSSAKSGDDLSAFMELWASNDWNASAALRDYNSSAVEQRDNNYFYSMYKRNVWPAIQTMPAVVNIVNSLSKNEVVEPSDVATNEYKNV